jgi:hypothetical protein
LISQHIGRAEEELRQSQAALASPAPPATAALDLGSQAAYDPASDSAIEDVSDRTEAAPEVSSEPEDEDVAPPLSAMVVPSPRAPQGLRTSPEESDGVELPSFLRRDADVGRHLPPRPFIASEAVEEVAPPQDAVAASVQVELRRIRNLLASGLEASR